MARIIEFYILLGFQKKETPQPDSQKGKIIELSAMCTKSA